MGSTSPGAGESALGLDFSVTGSHTISYDTADEYQTRPTWENNARKTAAPSHSSPSPDNPVASTLTLYRMRYEPANSETEGNGDDVPK